MKKHLKFVLFLGAMALIAYLILDLKKEQRYDKVEAVKKLAAKEFLGIKVLDIFLGVLAVAFVGITAGYVVSLVKGSGKRPAPSAAAVLPGEGGLPLAEAEAPISAERAPRKKLALEKVLGRTGAKIVSVLLVIVLVLVVLSIIYLLFPHKFPFLEKLFEKIAPGCIS
jgi:hypothetical protein